MIFNKKALVGVALATILALSASAEFTKTNTYTDDTFTDIPATEWYAKEVQSTYELGLMNGKGAGIFAPDGNVTVAEAITMASRAASIYAGEAIPSADGEWYQMYVNYAISKGFVKEGQFDDYDRPAKRYEVALLFEGAMPDGYFTAKNNVTEIPDVSEKYEYSDALLNLYKAGVVMGSDSYGNFFPENNITRAEAAAIINRVALPENRLARTLLVYSDDDAYLLCKNTKMNAAKAGINSGWRLDNRGGLPKQTVDGAYENLTDVSNTTGAALIREFNKITTGKISLETKISTSKFEGIALEFKNDKDETVYKLVSDSNKWNIVGADGTKTPVYNVADGEANFVFRIDVDLDNGVSKTVINKTECGSHPLIANDLNVLNFRFATEDAPTPSLTVGTVKLFVNYPVNDEFLFESDGTLPYGWTGYNAVSSNGMLQITNGTATRYFNPVSGTVIGNFELILDKNENISVNLNSGAKNIVSFTSDGTSFYANGVKVYGKYVKNLWYRIRIEAITEESKAKIYLNGRVIAEVPFAEETTSIDNMSFVNSSDDTAHFDIIKVFEKKYHDDYVPIPVKPAGEEKYTVGMNVCSLWRNGDHYGWNTISAYEDPLPVLGFYDEGNPETADWEIKYLIEHGIDFQAFCWYAQYANKPQKELHLSDHLYDGFMYAEYSDMTKYCLLWECMNAAKPDSFESFKNYYAPYFIENFLKDPRYMVIDNKPIISVFGQSYLATSLGGNANVKKCFDYLEEEARKLGFDGIIYVCCGTGSAANYEMGFDGCHAYGWGTNGYLFETNKQNITSSSNYKNMHTIPTISVGFNSIPWHNVRYPLMSVEDYRKSHEWVKNEYLPKYAESGTWEENLVWLSTWNEYGEGTYIMPSQGNGGFGYIDVIRELYTDEKADESVNTVPNATQRERINHLFPQYRRLLNNTGYYSKQTDVNSLESVCTINYSDKTNKKTVHLEGTHEYKEDGIHGYVNGDSHIIATGVEIDADKTDYLRITMNVSKGTNVDIFFITESDNKWSESKKASFITDKDTLNEYLVDMSKVTTWSGKVIGVRIDPGEVAKGTGDPDKNRFHIKTVEALAEKQAASTNIVVNGTTYEMQFNYEMTNDGQMLAAFDPEIALDFILNIFHTWDFDNKTLTLESDKHTVVYKMDSSEYTVDGVKKKLGYTMYQTDGLPMIPLKKLAEDMEFDYSVNENSEAVIYTGQKEYYETIANRVPSSWEFDSEFGDTEGWTSGRMNLIVQDGYLRAVSNSDSNDPILQQGKDVNLVAAKYKSVEVKCRYKFPKEKEGQHIAFYFTTDKVSSMSESLSVKLPLTGYDTNGEWVTVTADLTKVISWKDTIKQLRFDPFDTTGEMDIDYIRFIEDPDYSPENAALAEAKKETDALLASGVTYEIIGGDAESEKHGFFSNNADIIIVKDPVNENNKCFFVAPKTDTKQWIYIRHNIIFKPGATYKGSCDVMVASHGSSMELADDFKADLVANARYGGSAEKSEDHMTDSRLSYKKSDGWVHYEFEFTVNESSDMRNKDQMSFFANPVGDKGVGYYIDNIVLEEVK